MLFSCETEKENKLVWFRIFHDKLTRPFHILQTILQKKTEQLPIKIRWNIKADESQVRPRYISQDLHWRIGLSTFARFSSPSRARRLFSVPGEAALPAGKNAAASAK